MDISIDTIKELREQCGAGIMECRNALVYAEGDLEKALESLKEKGCIKAAEKAERVTEQGLVEAYIHIGGRIGAMVELNCETDFVARTDEFKELAHNLAMQVAAMSPQFISEEEIPPEKKGDFEIESACLLQQSYIKDPTLTVRDIIVQNIAKIGENIKISRFTRFELGIR
ncbi:MAG: translation elongation factor Ts [Dehalococcoidia bacterium]|nr:MAG: translation elongation factor Ts [Dehalococcoidia bacterium]